MTATKPRFSTPRKRKSPTPKPPPTLVLTYEDVELLVEALVDYKVLKLSEREELRVERVLGRLIAFKYHAPRVDEDPE